MSFGKLATTHSWMPSPPQQLTKALSHEVKCQPATPTKPHCRLRRLNVLCIIYMFLVEGKMLPVATKCHLLLLKYHPLLLVATYMDGQRMYQNNNTKSSSLTKCRLMLSSPTKMSQYLSSYQDESRLVTVRADDCFIALFL